jgi:hypothetical protein
MSGWQDMVKGNPVDWLLEPDVQNPAVRYLALRDLQDLPADSPELIQAKADAFSTGSVAAILCRMRPEGFWVKPGGGYGPKFTGSVWALVTLAQMGADVSHPEVRLAAEYLLGHTIAPAGWFSYNGTNPGLLHCHAGYLAAAMLDLGMTGDQKVMNAVEWQARLITGEDIAEVGDESPIRYYRYTPGPGFVCSANTGMPCAWGVVKAMGALSRVNCHQRSRTIHEAIETGRQFLFGTNLKICDFPTRDKSKDYRAWFKLGFPMLYSSDILEVLEVLTRLGDGADSRLQAIWQLVLDKQDAEGRWLMESAHDGKKWVEIEEKGQPGKWVTLRALRALKAAFPS